MLANWSVMHGLSIKIIFIAAVVASRGFLFAAPPDAPSVMTGRAHGELTALDNMMAAMMKK
jgi:hypothetical protein